jgi:hypothetical protein
MRPIGWMKLYMPIKLNDILIINKDEVYRIARAEFDQTYQGLDGE